MSASVAAQRPLSPPTRPFSPPNRSFSPPSRLPTRPSTPSSPSPSGSGAYSRRASAGAGASSTRLEHLRPSDQEVASFEELCKARYYDNDVAAAAIVESTLRSTTLPSHRAVYTKLMAQVRASAHEEHARRRVVELNRVMSDTRSGAAIVAALSGDSSVQGLRSSKAKTERKTRLLRFLRGHCLRNLPGPHPFLRGLYTVLWLQSLRVASGGAGGRRIAWEIQDEVWMESGGPEFLHDGIDLLKSVLGFEEIQADTRTSADRHPHDGDQDAASLPSHLHFDSSRPSIDNRPKRAPPAPPPRRHRDKPASDPFLDPEGNAAASAAPSNPGSPTTSPRPSPDLSSHSHPPHLSSQPHSQIHASPNNRVFLVPAYLTDPELRNLLSVFPDYISSKARGARFTSGEPDSELTTVTTPTPKALEEGIRMEQLKAGTGRIWIGKELREEAWAGSGMERLMAWFRRVLLRKE